MSDSEQKTDGSTWRVFLNDGTCRTHRGCELYFQGGSLAIVTAGEGVERRALAYYAPGRWEDAIDIHAITPENMVELSRDDLYRSAGYDDGVRAGRASAVAEMNAAMAEARANGVPVPGAPDTPEAP